jgi:hypothetical protein
LYRDLHFLIGRSAPVRRSSEFLLHFLKVAISSVVCLSPVIDCETFLRRRIILNAGGVLSGAIGRRTTPYTARPLGSALILLINYRNNVLLKLIVELLEFSMRLFCMTWEGRVAQSV